MHGTSLISEAADSPHRLVKQFRGELYCGFAELDPYAPMSMVKELDELLRPCPVAYRHAVHPGAQHGYALPNRNLRRAGGGARLGADLRDVQPSDSGVHHVGAV